MKKLITLCLLLVAAGLQAQTLDDQLDSETAKLPAAPEKYYIEYSFLKNYNMADNSYNKAGVRNKSWNAQRNDAGDKQDIQRVNDIRWVFKTEKEAKTFYDKYHAMLSEDGPEIKDHKTFSVDEMHVYGISDGMKKLNDALGLKMQFFNYVFLQGKTVAKLFVTTLDTSTIEATYFLPEEAIRRIVEAK